MGNVPVDFEYESVRSWHLLFRMLITAVLEAFGGSDFPRNSFIKEIESLLDRRIQVILYHGYL
jgi:hypothetical protein